MDQLRLLLEVAGVLLLAAFAVLVGMLVFGGERGLRLAGSLLARVIYRVRAHGVERLPAGGFLLVPNHVSYVDAIVLQLACPRPVRFLIHEEIFNNRWLHWVFRRVGAMPVSSSHAKEVVRKAADLVARGEVVCMFPEGELTRSGSLLRLKRGFELVARQAGGPVVPVWLDELWGSVFSYEKGRAFWKWPKRLPFRLQVAFGAPLAPADAGVAAVREEMLKLGEFCYQQRPILRKHLAEPCVRGLVRRQFRIAVVDGMDGGELTAGSLLAAAAALAGNLRRTCPRRRIAVVLPPGRGAIVANLGVLLAGKVPVNLNFTAGRAALESSIARGLLADAVSAHKFVQKLGDDFPWPENVIHLEKLLPALKKKIVFWRLLVLLLPAWVLLRLLRVPRVGDRDEAVLLFTSGSSGEPKGVVLSHRNLLGNVSQFGMMLSLDRHDKILACLPIFHSFGCTVTLWYPMIEGVGIVTYPSPLEIAKNIEMIETHRVTVVLSTPTFLRGYLRKAKPEQLRSLKLVITGAEKLPREVAEKFQELFGHAVLEGYGLTETSPVVSTNLPDPVADRPGLSVQNAHRPGSVGRLAPGMAAQVRHPDTGEPLSLHDSGMLWLRGPNIFEGYLDQPEKSAEVLRDGWFMTGDLARFDEDGFLFIEGRLARFSKIGGEMVPHETVEARIAEVLGIGPDDERSIAIAGIPDKAKGEALVLLTTRDIEIASLRQDLAAAGLPNLFIPRVVVKVDAIPLLGSGKLDLKACRQIALERAGTE